MAAGHTPTTTSVRVLELPRIGRRLAVLTLSAGARPATLGAEGLTNLSRALDSVADLDVQAVAVTGERDIFCAGADLGTFRAATDRRAVQEFVHLGHTVFERLTDLDVPTFALVNGAALGGGLELALHCRYRVVASSVRSVGFPEVGLGLLPGWGGTWLLPHLIGVDAAVDVIVNAPLSGGRLRSAAQAVQAGIVDDMIDSVDFQSSAIAWVDDVLAEQRTVLRRVVDYDESAWQAAVASGTAAADARVNGAAPAAYRALDLLAQARTADRHTAYAGEDRALTDLVFTAEAQAAMYAAGLRRRAAKRVGERSSATGARGVRRVGVVGAGLMASQLAVLFATELKVPVVMCDVDQDRADRGLARVHAALAAEQRRGRLSEDQARRIRADISASGKLSALADADLVIEAVFEDLAVKQGMLAELEPLLSQTCVIATNTSSLSLHEMARALQRPERFVGMHFFNPVLRMPLLEIVEANDTDAPTMVTALEVGLALGKCCVTVRDRPGFVVNRLLTRMFVELLRSIDEGTSPSVADAALDGLGLPMSPFALLELIGPAVQLHINETLADTWPDRFPVSPNLRRLVAAGLSGFVETTSPRRRPLQAPLDVPVDVVAILEQGDNPSSALTVANRVRQALADEARLILREQVVPSAQDIDTCMILGAGWPAHLGGLTPWLDRSVPAGYGERFLPPGMASLPAS